MNEMMNSPLPFLSKQKKHRIKNTRRSPRKGVWDLKRALLPASLGTSPPSPYFSPLNGEIHISGGKKGWEGSKLSMLSSEYQAKTRHSKYLMRSKDTGSAKNKASRRMLAPAPREIQKGNCRKGPIHFITTGAHTCHRGTHLSAATRRPGAFWLAGLVYDPLASWLLQHS